MANRGKPEDPEQLAKSIALRLLARREHSRFELVTKLRQRRVDSRVIDPVLDEFEAEGWLSDERFADVYARQRFELGYGPLRIRSELQQRGIRFTPACINDVSEHRWRQQAIAVRRRRFGLKDLRDDWKEKGRQARFLSQRGFSGEQVEQALEITGPEDDELGLADYPH